MLLLAAVCALCCWTCIVDGGAGEQNNKLLQPVFCYAKCIGRCLKARTNASLDDCVVGCSAYTFTEPCQTNGSKCWKEAIDVICPDEGDGGDVPRHEPLDLRASYVADPYEQPYLVKLKWTPVQYAQFYMVQVKDMDDRFSHFGQGSADHFLFFRTTQAQIRKSHLCPTYGFRVAAVNSAGVSNFSDVVTIKAPVPKLVDWSYELLDVRALDKPFIVDDNLQTNRTISINVRLRLPANWNAEDLVGVQTHLIWMSCSSQVAVDSVILSKTVSLMNESRVSVLVPEIHWDVPCKVMLRIEQMETVCRTVYYYPDVFPESNSPGIVMLLDCNSVLDSNCEPPARPAFPLCNADEFVFEALPVGNDSGFVNLNISWSMKSTKAPILYYAIEVHELEQKPTNSGNFHVAAPIRKVFEYRTCTVDDSGELTNFDNSTTTVFVPKLPTGSKYGVYICGMFDAKGEQTVQWNITARQEVDLSRLPYKQKLSHAKSSNTLVICVSTLLIVAAVVGVVLGGCRLHSIYWQRKKRKSLDQLAREGFGPASFDNPYVIQPRRTDHWEIGRSQVEIDYDQKLGAGAFGAVYKGKLNGRLSGSKLSNSPVAENWTRAEDCLVAVKMLPEYADDSSKSDFRKEINLMKRLGYHEKLVNMLACITVDEPLCLIVEYCSDGDLLHYLRDRRQYMLKLEQSGVDVANVDDNADVDFSMVLCLKDLLSFSWQICVGLEFLSQKGYVHRDVAARNVLVDQGKRIKIGDFGLCRFMCTETAYMGKGGRLPIKWMAPEAIKNYEFTTKSDVWSFGILLFEIITLGGSPYPSIQPSDVEQILKDGKRMEQPVNCPDDLYAVMLSCWQIDADSRPTFSETRENLRAMLEVMTEDYNYTGLSQHREYYNVLNSDDDDELQEDGQQQSSSSDGVVNQAFRPEKD